MITWRPGIHDPTFIGWFTTVCYFAAAWLCARAAKSGRLDQNARREQPDARRGSPAFWVILAVVLTVLGLNKQLDLQTPFAEIGRELAKAQGWYGRRADMQGVFVASIAVLGAILLAIFGVLIRRSLRRQGIALAGMVLLVCFVVIRASSFHHIDAVLVTRIAGMQLDWILELAGSACVGICAARDVRGKARAAPG